MALASRRLLRCACPPPGEPPLQFVAWDWLEGVRREPHPRLLALPGGPPGLDLGRRAQRGALLQDIPVAEGARGRARERTPSVNARLPPCGCQEMYNESTKRSLSLLRIQLHN